jgi:tRNA1(Val) A37 N6-methylase TrmN6
LPPSSGMGEGDLELTEDTLLAGRVRLLQPRRGHRAGTDAVLLAATVAPDAGEVVYDLGAGVGAVGLMIAARNDATMVLVEKEPALAALCRRNIALNGFGTRLSVVEADLLAPGAARREAGLSPESADIVVTNPPFLDDATARRSPEALRSDAHHLPEGGFERWIAAAADILRPRGRLGLVHRADRLAACLARLSQGFGAVTVRPVHPRAHEPAMRVLLTARKGSRSPLRLLPALVLHDADGSFTPAAAAIHAGEALLQTETGARRRPS